MPILNQEQFEAYQADITAKRKTFMDQLSEENQSKFEAVEKASKILIDANIWFYLFPMLPNPINPEVDSAWQWNSSGHLIKCDPNGFPTEESAVKLKDFFQSTLSSVYSNLVRQQLFHDLEGHKLFNKFCCYLADCIEREGQKYEPKKIDN